MDNDQIVESLQEKMQKAFHLSMQVAYGELNHEGHYFTVRECKDVQDDRIWGWADGLMHGYLERQMSGRCSLQAMIDFDIEKFEAQVDKDIAFFEKLFEKLGKPVRLTKEEMRKRGYTVR